MIFRLLASALLALWHSLAAATAPAAAPCTTSAPHFPERSAQAPSASAFVQAVTTMSEPERDLAIRQELMAGNLPDFLRQLHPVSLRARLTGGRAVRLTLCVLADYLSLGTDDDFLLVPMGLASALSVATRFGFTLPTRRMVDAIYAQSRLRLKPQPLPASDQMRSTDYYLQHNLLVKQQRAQAGLGPDVLTAGHKKDLVLSPRLWRMPGRVAIYGWHRAIGAAIQPLSTVHGARYADYSHGVRLVSKVVYVNGQARPLDVLLNDPQLSALVSDEGPLPQAAERLIEPPLLTLGQPEL